ncbi:hypothetical protein HF290_17075 [Acidithiobacillus ferrooxidans]|nr:hypothetical protein [Acidithiobacillus ferrooxidans]
MLLAAILAALPGIASATPLQGATPLSQMQADAAAIQQLGATWSQIQSASRNYAALAPFAAQEWAGQGPTVVAPLGGVEQCHNTHWDTVTGGLVTGGMNIVGDAEAESYAMQTLTVDFQAQLGNYMVQQTQAGNSAVVNRLAALNGPLMQSMHTLSGLLNTAGNQVAAAMGPSTAMHPLPITVWQAGIGNVPNLAAVQYLAGPDDGAPIGWSVMPLSAMARLVDVCPTGTGSIPMLPLAAPVLSAAQQAVVDAPDLASALQPLESGSSYTIPGGGNVTGSLAALDGYYRTRMNLVQALASDMQPLAGYMQPIDQPLALYRQQVQQIMGEVD